MDTQTSGEKQPNFFCFALRVTVLLTSVFFSFIEVLLTNKTIFT